LSLFRRNPRRDNNEQTIRAVLEKYGWSWWSISGRGIPDAVVCKRGVLALVEIKNRDGKNRLTEAQLRTFSEMRAMRVPLYVLHDAEDVRLMDEAIFSGPSPVQC